MIKNKINLINKQNATRECDLCQLMRGFLWNPEIAGDQLRLEFFTGPACVWWRFLDVAGGEHALVVAKPEGKRFLRA